MDKINLNKYPPLDDEFRGMTDLEMLKSQQKYLNDLKVGDEVYVLRNLTETQLHNWYTCKIARFENNNILLERWADRFSCETYENNINTQLLPINKITTLILERCHKSYMLLYNIACDIHQYSNKIAIPFEEAQKFHQLLQKEIKKVKKNENN